MAHLCHLAVQARFLGSHHHLIEPFKGAISAVHISLISLAYLPLDTRPVAYGSRCTRLGRPYVGIDPIEGWEEAADNTQKMLKNFDALCVGLERKWKLQDGTSSIDQKFIE